MSTTLTVVLTPGPTSPMVPASSEVDWSRLHVLMAAAEAQRLLVHAIAVLSDAGEAVGTTGRRALDLIAGSIVTNVALIHQLKQSVPRTDPLRSLPRANGTQGAFLSTTTSTLSASCVDISMQAAGE